MKNLSLIMTIVKTYLFPFLDGSSVIEQEICHNRKILDLNSAVKIF